MSKSSPDDYVTFRECASVRIRIERRLTRVEILVSIQIILLIVTLLQFFFGK